MNANVREIHPPEGHLGVGDLPPLQAVPGEPTCSECGAVIKTKKPARSCSPRCRAAASRRRRVEDELGKLASAEAALLAALKVVADLRADLTRRVA